MANLTFTFLAVLLVGQSLAKLQYCKKIQFGESECTCKDNRGRTMRLDNGTFINNFYGVRNPTHKQIMYVVSPCQPQNWDITSCMDLGAGKVEGDKCTSLGSGYDSDFVVVNGQLQMKFSSQESGGALTLNLNCPSYDETRISFVSETTPNQVVLNLTAPAVCPLYK